MGAATSTAAPGRFPSRVVLRRSLWYDPMELAVPFAQYGVEARSSWAKELARRMQILATYDVHETGVSEDNIDGGQIVCGDWFKIRASHGTKVRAGHNGLAAGGAWGQPREPHHAHYRCG